jgi:hypothetical protein
MYGARKDDHYGTPHMDGSKKGRPAKGWRRMVAAAPAAMLAGALTAAERAPVTKHVGALATTAERGRSAGEAVPVTVPARGRLLLRRCHEMRWWRPEWW